MLDVDGNIKLIDFGCAKRLKKNQNTHSMRQILKSMKGSNKQKSLLIFFFSK
jgi:serine/threonine protein kinase